MRFIVCDTETTGIDPQKDRIVEIAAATATSYGTLFTLSELCNPGMPIPPEAMAVHHITDDMVADKEPSEIVVPRVIDAMTTSPIDTILVAHNAEFDRAMIRAVYPEENANWLCTWRCAMHLWPEAPSHSNQVLRYWLKLSPNIPEDLYPHRALYDVVVTEAILERMLKERDAEELIRLSDTPVVLHRARFGKYRGMLWKDIPKDYLLWIVKQSDMDADVRHTAMHHLR